MVVETKNETEHKQWVKEVLEIGNRAVQRAQEESRRMGIPNVYAIDGKIVYELPNGEMTHENPIPAMENGKPKQSSPARNASDGSKST